LEEVLFFLKGVYFVVKGNLMIAGCAVVGILLGSVVSRNVDKAINT